MKVKVKYFAMLREEVGLSEEFVDVPTAAPPVADVRCACIELQKEAFEKVRRIRAAVDGVMASDDVSVPEGAEMAFFPPVTGG